MRRRNHLREKPWKLNPPFAKGADIDHVIKAYACLKYAGVLVAVMSSGPFFREDRKAQEFRAWLETISHTVDALPPDTFKSSGTGVNCKLVRISRGA